MSKYEKPPKETDESDNVAPLEPVELPPWSQESNEEKQNDDLDYGIYWLPLVGILITGFYFMSKFKNVINFRLNRVGWNVKSIVSNN